MSLLAHHNLVSFIIHTERWSLTVVQTTVRDLPAVCPSNLVSYHFSLCLFYFRHTGLLAISNMLRTLPFMASVLAVSSFLLLRMSFFQISACFPHSLQPVLSSTVTSATPFLTLPTISQTHPASLHLLVLVLPHVLCPSTPPECRFRESGPWSCPLPYLKHLEQCSYTVRPN